MVKEKFKSKVDCWLVCVIVMLSVLPIAPILWVDFSISLFCGVAVVLCFNLVMIFSISYTVDSTYLIVKYGFFFSQRYLIDELQSVRFTRTFLSAPAASLDRLELKFCRAVVVVSPKEKQRFVKCLEDACPHKISIDLNNKHVG